MTRRPFLALLAALSVLSPAHAQVSSTSGPPWSSPASNIIVPQIGRPMIVRPGSEAVRIASVSVEVQVTDQVASTAMKLTLSNPSGRPLETELILPVPQGATVSRMELEGLASGEGVARVLPADEARRIYEAIVRGSRDPGLVEFIGFNLIRTSVFPVPANGTQNVTLVYEQVLPADGQRIDYVLPRSESLESRGANWSYGISLKSRAEISTVYSPTHELITERTSPTEFKLRVSPTSQNNPGSLRISYLLSNAPQEPAATIVAYPDPSLSQIGGGYFMLLVGLPPEEKLARPAIKREITLVMDRSGSMRGPKFDQAKAAALQVIEGLDDGELFNLIDYSDQIASFSEAPVVKDADSIKRIRGYIADLKAVGGTNIFDAVQEALKPKPCEGCLPIVLFLTDGLATVGRTGEVEIREAAKAANIHNRRVFTFGVGHDVNVPLLSNLATASRATSTFVQPDENIEVKVGQVFRRLAGPVFAFPKIEQIGVGPGEGALGDLQPAELPDVFEGDQILVLGNYTGHMPRTIRVSGNYRGKDMSFDFKFDPNAATTRNAFVPRLWATRKVNWLVDSIRQLSVSPAYVTSGQNPAENPRIKELMDEVIRLSMTYGILTEYTAFLAADSGDLARGGVPEEPGLLHLQWQSRFGNEVDTKLAAPAARRGEQAVRQQENIAAKVYSIRPDYSNSYIDTNGLQVEQLGCQLVADQTMFKRGNRWVDARILKCTADEQNNPDQTIEFASDDYFKLADRLATEGRQGFLNQRCEIYLMVGAKRVLITGL